MAPVFGVLADVTVEETDPAGTPVSLTAPVVTDYLDPSPTLSNNAPALYSLGTTSVTWTARDASGNTRTRNQTVTVVPGSLSNQLANLVKLITERTAAGQIDSMVTGPLLAKVDAATGALARGNPNDAKAALGELKALVNYVQAQTDKKITAPAANEIIARANAIIALLDR